MIHLPLKKTVSFLIVLLWLIAMTVLISRHYGLFIRSPAASGISAAGAAPSDNWMGVYYRGDRVGSLHRVLRQAEGGFLFSEKMRLRLTLMDFQKEIETETTARLDRRLGLEQFEFTMKADAPLRVTGRVESGKLRLAMEAGGRRSESFLPMEDASLLNMSPAQDVFRDGISIGMKKSVSVFDPLSMSRQVVALEVHGREKLMVMGRQMDVYRVTASVAGSELSFWVTSSGEVMKEESPLGFTLLRETAGDAADVRASRDLMVGTAVPFNLRIPEDVRYLKVRISGVDLKPLELEGGRQKLQGDVVEIRREAPVDLAGRTAVPLPEEYLSDTFFVSSRDPKIVALSQEIVGSEKDPVRAARLIYNWVYRNIEKVPAVTLPVATEVLEKRRGDCNEHTTLYTALARAAGIPARISLGLTHRQGSFYYHAWPEVYAGRWIAVDPTLGQFPADASHIRLITGDINSQARILPLLGRIQLEGISYR